ncbi:granzyme H-like isoform X1 [Diceros bicornis minor]|uniref:granzyme H-like isoform X1 n=1 Tax=Diceros bicornis minor TaxID=77932 RepID=UPI0026EEA70C|nr:granzyme H-like isoform X1 [Diceros bicornis minor]XP_058396350.1 granzyme H-like isoform X1 [Diceros bicornis minor]
MQPLLLLLAFLLPPRAEAGEIIGGHEAKPHSRPYMALVQFLVKEGRKMCGGALVGEDFVLTAAHCLGSSISVTLGAHNIQKQERTQQVIPVRRAIPHPGYDPNNISNDIMLLELARKAKQTAAVKPLSLPWGKAQGDSGGPLMCKNVIQGIVSYGRSDGSPPRAYTKVSSFLPWIKKTMKSL